MKYNWNRLRLKWKIFAFLLGFCSILLVTLWLFQTVFLDSFYRSIKVMEIKNQTTVIESKLDQEGLPELITSISQQGELSVEILELSGVIILKADSPRDLPFLPLSLQQKEDLIQTAREQGGEYIKVQGLSTQAFPEKTEPFMGKIPKEMNTNGQFLIYIRLVENSSGDLFAIYMNSLITPVTATVTTLRFQLYVITAMMVVLSVVLAFMIARRVSEPIEEINQSAKSLVKGDFSVHFNGKGFLEIDELSNTLNSAAKELSKVEALRKELIANVSHDLRTPLSLIYGYAEVMHDFPEEIKSEQTQVIMNETARLTKLVNDLLDLSKLENGAEILECKVWNITEAISIMAVRLEELLKKENYQIQFQFDQDIYVWADESKMSQAIYNLLQNAVHYTGEDHCVLIRQIVKANQVEISIIDTGDGIATDELDHIWDRYYRGGKAHKRAQNGSGLGLSIVKKVMELHKIEVGVESHQGHGSRFWFRMDILTKP